MLTFCVKSLSDYDLYCDLNPNPFNKGLDKDRDYCSKIQTSSDISLSVRGARLTFVFTLNTFILDVCI